MAVSDPLSELIVDADEIDRAALARALKNRVAIDKASGRLVIEDGYDSLDAKRKVLALILVKKASRLLQASDAETLSYKELVSNSGIPEGTVAPALKALKEAHLVAQDGNKAYYVPNASMLRAIRFLENRA